MTVNISTTLANFISSSSVKRIQITPETDLMENELLDSLMLMDLVLFVEQTWGVALMGHDFAPAHFRTINRLTELIESRRLSESA